MCRLYGLRATHPTGLDCGLIDAQNSLLQQARGDTTGAGNPDGWGLAVRTDGDLERRREAAPAYSSEAYRREATDLEGTTILAHLRRATNGRPAERNTHPFRHRSALLAHNGHLPAFERARPWILEQIAPSLRREIQGETGSEHLFYWLLSRLRDRTGGRSSPPPALLRDVLRDTITDLVAWYATSAPEHRYPPDGPPDDREAGVALNVLWAVGDRLAGSRAGRSLWYREREGAHRCGICGDLHPKPAPDGYRAVAVASERITDEAWTEVPEPAVFHVDDGFRLSVEPLAL